MTQQQTTARKITGLHHLGVPVRSMEASVAWYRDVLGVETTFVHQAEEGPGLDAATQLPGSRLRYAFAELGNTALEFLDYERPEPREHDRRNCDVGAVHICFEVEDIHAMYESLLEHGVSVNGPPNLIETGPIAGCWFCYFRDPDGIQLEIFQTP
jgi:catechol 2,3-dioxygenase-like lactoylglutathione lyase family enzyme